MPSSQRRSQSQTDPRTPIPWALSVGLVGLICAGCSVNLGHTPAETLQAALDGKLKATTKFTMVLERFDPATGKIMSLPKPPTPRNLFQVIPYENSLIVLGGIGETGQPEQSVEQFTPATGTWKKLAPWTTSRAAKLDWIGHKLYAAGGNDTAGRPIAQIDAYDPVANTWTSGSPWPHPRQSFFYVIKDRWYAVLGYDAKFGQASASIASSQLVDSYNTSTDSWADGASLPERNDLPGQVLRDGKVYVLGGSNTLGNRTFAAQDMSYVYDPAADSWKKLAPLPSARGGALVKVLDGRIFIVGGYDSAHGTNPDASPQDHSMLIYDPAADTWSKGPQMPTDRFLFSNAVIGDQLLIYFGLAADKGPLLDRYDAKAGTWQAAPNPTDPIDSGAFATVTHAGELYVLNIWSPSSGKASQPGLGKLSKYSPKANAWSLVGQRSPSDRSALIDMVSLGDSIFLVGTNTDISLGSTAAK
jgi:hypothetical protein